MTWARSAPWPRKRAESAWASYMGTTASVARSWHGCGTGGLMDAYGTRNGMKKHSKVIRNGVFSWGFNILNDMN